MSEPSSGAAPGFRRILCPIDFSDFSRHALDQALAVAHCCSASLSAVHVLPLLPYGDPMVTPAVVFTAEDIERTRQELLTFVAKEAGRAIDAQVFQGGVVETIVTHAEATGVDLIVMGTHGRSGFERLMLGSVTERVLRKASCPVLTVPRRAPDAVAAGPAAFERVLCAVDFSPASDRALAHAVSLARQCRAHLTLMHAVEALSVYEPVVFEGNLAMLDDLRKAAAVRIHQSVPEGLDVAEVVVTGKPYREILQRAGDEHADLIVIGVHSGLADRFHLGSTTNHIVREAMCPVLTVR